MKETLYFKNYPDRLVFAANQNIKEREYWLKKLSGCPVKADFPYDHKKTDRQPSKNTVKFRFEEELYSRLMTVANESDARLHMILAAGVFALLHRYSGSSDIIIGTPVYKAAVQGEFINTVLALRNRVEEDTSFKELLLQVRETVSEADEHQDYPIEILAEQLNMSVSTGEFPLFGTAVVLENIQDKSSLGHIYDNIDMIFCFLRAGECIEGVIHYNPLLYKEDTVGRLAAHFKILMKNGLFNPGLPVPCIEILTGEDKRQLLVDFNDTGREYPRDKTIHELFEQQAARVGDRVAVIGGASGPGAVHLAYNLLNEKSNRLAGLLKKKGVSTDTIVAVMLERSLEMLIAMLGILKAGGAYLPIDPEYPRERIDYMLADSRAGIVMSEQAPPTPSGHPSQEGTSNHTATVRNPLAYIIYTSGSTGRPKGVMVAHRNVLRLVINTDYVELNGKTRILQTGAPVFDATTFEIWGSLLNGGQLVLVKKEVILDASRLGRAIEKHHINTLWLSSPLFNQLARENCDIFSTLQYLLVGGDVLSPRYIGLVRGRSKNLKIINGYGPTENTTFSTTFLIDKDFEDTIPIGTPIANSTAYIVNKSGGIQPKGVFGQLWVGGDGVSRGYLNSPEMTSEKFLTLHPSPLYKTGDLCRWLPDGNIEFAGRIDQQIKIRGFRIELREIENCLTKHKEIDEAVVIDLKDKNDDKYLCAFIVSGIRLSAAQLRDYLAQELPGYMIPSYFTQVEKIPLTANGKIDGKALLEFQVSNAKFQREYTPPRDGIEKQLAEIWLEVLPGLHDSVGIDDDFFELGGHSLKAMLLAAKIHKELNVKVPLVEIFQGPTIREFAGYIKGVGVGEDRYAPLEPVEKKEYYPPSAAQKRLYVLQQLDENSIGYNIPWLLELHGTFHKGRLEKAFRKLIERHVSLRTSFELVNEAPVQGIHDEVEFSIEYYEFVPHHSSFIIHHFIRPFALSRAPLVRAGLIKRDEAEHILMVDIHHIVSDGTSMDVFVKDFMSFYQGKQLARLRVQYKDFSQWQNSEREQEALKQQGRYWLGQFAGEIPVLNLPCDYSRPAVQSFEGSVLHFEIGEEDTRGLKQYALEESATLYMVLLSLYIIFLAKVGGQEDIVVGTPVAGRGHADLQSIIGMFVNTLPLRNFPVGGKTCKQFLGEVKDRALAAFANQDYPYEELVELVTVDRDAGRNPLFDAMFTLQNVEISQLHIPGLTLKPYDYENKKAKFDLSLYAVEAGERLRFTMEYCIKLFREETIRRFSGYFKKVLSRVLERPARKIAQIEIISGEEKRQLLFDFNDTAKEYPRDKTVHELFAEEAEKRPDSIAVIGNHEGHEGHEGVVSITYREFDRESGRLAHLLEKKGVTPGTIVGIMRGRSIEMVIGIFAILKAGGAYLPIDPDYPEERKQYILKDSRAVGLVIGEVRGEEYRQIEFGPAHPRCAPCALRLAYVIYTSGSTGKPKGVMVAHPPVVNVLFALQRLYPFRESDVYLFKTSYVFDVSVTELFGWFPGGGRLAVLEKGAEKDPGKIIEAIEGYRVTHINFVPSMFGVFVDFLESSGEWNREPLALLRYIFLAGEALLPHHIEKFRRTAPGIVLENIYGPTEAAVYTTGYSLSAWDGSGSIPIGKPLQNVKVYIIGTDDHLNPIGAAGELCVAGEGLARGYLNRPQLTAEKFLTAKTRPSPLYKTGDLTRWLPGGDIEFLGRIDSQVKIRGFRIEPGEIENILLSHDGIKEALVLVKEDDDKDRCLCAYIAVDSELAVPGLKEFLAVQLSSYMIPAYFVQLEKLPLTASGKIDRGALPPPDRAGVSGDYTAPRDEIEEKLTAIWAEVLSVGKDGIGIDTNFFTMGGHSLKAIAMVSKLHKAFNARVPLAEIFKTPSVRGLSKYIKKAAQDRHISINKAEKREYYNVSSAQERLYILEETGDLGATYNLPEVWEIAGKIDAQRLEQAFRALIQRHESLRTSFHMIGGEPVQRIHDTVTFEIEGEKIVEDFIRPFNLSQPPLLRVGLIKTAEEKYILMVDMHHIISDGVSMSILTRDFSCLYEGEKLPELKIQYKDFALWQGRRFAGGRIKELEHYWLDRFRDRGPVPGMPLDYPRPHVQDFSGDRVIFHIDKQLTGKIKETVSAAGTTLYTGLLAVLNILLSKYTEQEDIVVGIPAAGRNHADVESVMGFFVNTLAIRSRPAGRKTFGQFLQEVKENTLAAYENQDFPFDRLVDRLNIPRDPGRNPVFDVLFASENLDRPVLEVKGLEFSPYEFENKTSHLDLVLLTAESSEQLTMVLEYATALFKPSSAEKISQRYIEILKQVAENKEIKLKDIEISLELAEVKSTGSYDDYVDFDLGE